MLEALRRQAPANIWTLASRCSACCRRNRPQVAPLARLVSHLVGFSR